MTIQTGSVSHGTMRSEDLIPCFLSVLDDCKQDYALSVRPGGELESCERIGKLDSMMGDIERRAESEDYYESEDADYDLEWLFDTLGEFAPEGFYFGSHPGDGSDYGFWQSEDA